ncbi:MAG: hypothetical protein QY330_05125 [Candidatus Dojkabacteria bacterium]|uniref:Nucleoside 2-deoxyribosyltransferase n=2 Tax=Candidatus Dojkabacteria TaxID=74243 RepID=A0A136KGV9_9BACT|nr:MAG: hypothetical protein UZ20_WS6002000759 [candidate division WS6 bacterium OLB21]MBW7953622.1 hypothetical protein [Candidatus Dojkabacteria bacterium]WKZ27895.1 MAG: hypothetical protein QY330_05125 [Candidatus Dojkabacteria bacterium]
MNVYFAASTRNLSQNRTKFVKLLEVFKELGHVVLPSWIVEKLYSKESSDKRPQELVLDNTQLVQESDLVVIDLSTPSFGVGYLFGQALANHRPILCLYPETVSLESISEIVKGSTSSLVTLKSYSESNVRDIIRDYLAGMSLDSLRKFNFIASEEIMRFIEDGSVKEGKSKSEFLRDKILNELITK